MPDGLQPGLTGAVAVLLNKTAEVLALASLNQTGFTGEPKAQKLRFDWVGARFSETFVSAIFDRNGSRT